MGVIQNAVNQALGTVGVVSRLSPSYERKQELHQLNKMEPIVKEQHGLIGKKLEEEGEAIKSGDLKEFDKGTLAIMNENIDQIASLRRRQFQLDPTEESFKNLEKVVKGKSDIDSMVKEMQEVGAKQETRKQQKRNFMEYLGKLETSMGMNVGDLPPHMQKQIAKQYKKSDRKKLMDEEDKKR